jgi:hypothetical protein
MENEKTNLLISFYGHMILSQVVENIFAKSIFFIFATYFMIMYIIKKK